MKIIDYTDYSHYSEGVYYEDDYLGEVRIVCNCGNEFTVERAIVDDIIECKQCKRRGVIHGSGHGGVWIVSMEEEK